MSRYVAVLFLVLLALVITGRVNRSRAARAAATPAESAATRNRSPAAALQPPGRVSTPPAPSSGTPTIDLLARLEGRRRLLSASRATYFDSLFAETDSVVRRWPAREGAPYLLAVPPSDSAALDAHLLPVIRRAVAAWEEAGLGLRFEVVADTAGAQIVVRSTAQLEERRAGQTDLQWNREGAILSAAISLARNDDRGKPIPESILLAVAMHEIGHALGLAHSPNREDVMFQATQSSRLTARDRATYALLYELPLGSIRENPAR